MSETDLAGETAAIAAALAAPTEALGVRIEAARAAWSGDLRLRLLEGEWHEKSARPAEAEAIYRAAAALHPDNPWPVARIVGLLLATGHADAARALCTDALWGSSLPEAARMGLLSRLLTATPEPGAREAFLSGLLRGTADDRFVLLKLAALRFRLRDRAEATRLFEAARRHGALPVESELLELELHLAAGRFEPAFHMAQALSARHPERIDFARRAIQTAHFAQRPDLLIPALERALTRWPEDWLLVFRYNRAALPAAADAAMFALLATRVTQRRDDHRWLFQYTVAALRHRRTAEAMALLPRLAADSPVVHLAAPLHAALATRPHAAWETGRAIVNDAELDVQVVRHPAARATVIVLAGVQAGLGYLPFSHVDALLAGHPVNAVYLRDLHNRAFTQGVQGLAADADGTEIALRALLADLGGAPAITMGASLGGMAAVRLAARLHGHAAISFAGPVHLGIHDSEAAEGGSGDSTRFSLTSVFLRGQPGVPELLRAAPGTRVYQCYGPDYAPDAADAALLDGLANAECVQVPACRDHFVIEHMIADGGFDRVLTRAIATPAP